MKKLPNLIHLTYLLNVLIITFIILFSCKKTTPIYYIQPEFKQWVLFQKGSYWIYLNEKKLTIPDKVGHSFRSKVGQ
jgi:hypothetical protein